MREYQPSELGTNELVFIFGLIFLYLIPGYVSKYVFVLLLLILIGFTIRKYGFNK